MSAAKNHKWLKNIKSYVALFVWAFYVTMDNIYFIPVNTSLFSVDRFAVTPPQTM
jgi:hypothetical protein